MESLKEYTGLWKSENESTELNIYENEDIRFIKIEDYKEIWSKSNWFIGPNSEYLALHGEYPINTYAFKNLNGLNHLVLVKLNPKDGTEDISIVLKKVN